MDEISIFIAREQPKKGGWQKPKVKGDCHIAANPLIKQEWHNRFRSHVDVSSLPSSRSFPLQRAKRPPSRPPQASTYLPPCHTPHIASLSHNSASRLVSPRKQPEHDDPRSKWRSEILCEGESRRVALPPTS